MNHMDEKLDALWAEYRKACPDPEPGAGFMPGLWQKIEARRRSSSMVLRRLTQICVMSTAALTLLIGAVLIPRFERSPLYSATYVDVLSSDHHNTYVDVLTGDIK